MNFKILIILIFILCLNSNIYSQVEHIQVSHPVYILLVHFENLGLLPYKSLSNLPLQRKEIIECLKLARENDKDLSQN